MNSHLSRRDFLKLSGLGLTSLAMGRFVPDFSNFDDSNLIRIAAKSMSVYSAPSDKSMITASYGRDELIHVYEEVRAEEPKWNPVWYRVWGGYMHRGSIQHVKILPNIPLASIPEGTRQLAEVTVPFTQPWRYTKVYGWQALQWRLYYESVHWIDGVQEGPDGETWYRIFDELSGSYYVAGTDLRPIPHESLAPISPDVPWANKRIDVNLATQTLTAYEYDKAVFQTNIASGIPGGGGGKGLSTTTPSGQFHIQEKLPSKHMGNGNLFAGADDYELAGVPWTSFFTDVGHAFHGTYWHENFGTPQSHGCVNMRTNEAQWLFRWARPPHNVDSLSKNYYFRGYGTTVDIHY
ncbi:MAG: L,D-transpeptidase [Chloroflexi bacterium]|nr:L,D-transpeptidase [Chloroflexota bacterium]MBI3341090.1 L,D-transpeptidase [Chloroflexota bacterium]